METKRSLAGKEYLIGVAENQASPGDVTSSAVPTSAGPNFGTNSWGQTYGIASAIGKSSPLTMGLLLQINGNTNLSGLTGYNQSKPGNKPGFVQTVYVELTNSGGFQYTIWVWGAGPTGLTNGTLMLEFQDISYDAYSIGLFSSTPRWHFVQYNSKLPQLINFSWNELSG